MSYLSRKQMYYLLWVTIMNQSQSALSVIDNTEELLNRLGDDKYYDKLEYEQINLCFNTFPKLHRFPNKMAQNIYNSILTINSTFDNDISKVFKGSEKQVIGNLLQFGGISYHKANLCIHIIKCIENRNISSEQIRRECNCSITDEILFKELTVIENI